MNRIALALAAMALAAHAHAQQQQSFPLVLPWDDATASLTNVSALNHRPAGKYGYVRVKDGHLYTNAGRIRFLGVNICMGACFPDHGDAVRIAARMAKFGINCVRFHLMDMSPAPSGIFQPDMRTLDPGQMDRLDYFIAQLKQNGIYADLNLHVSRVYPNQPTWEGMPIFFKGIDNFVPEMMRLQREYARDLLTHYNPYTGTRYAAEPAVAFVEINNENGVLQLWGNGAMDGMPQPYQDELKRQWNAWLKVRYPAAGALQAAWSTADVPLGGEMLGPNPAGWVLEQHAGAVARHNVGAFGPNGETAHRVTVDQIGSQGWHVQLNYPGLSMSSGQPYTFTFWARANAPCTIGVSAVQAHSPWNTLWYDQADLTTQWQQYTFLVRPGASETLARIGFSEMGTRAGAYEFAGMSLRPGGSLPALRDAEPGTVPCFPHRGFATFPTAARRDWVRFLWDTEVQYWTGMYHFLRTDLQTHALTIGSQVCNSPEPIQAMMDVVDNHSYWKHPAFPGTAWDPENWTIENVPMAGDASSGTLGALAWRRAAGKPYVVTEYNHPAPNSYGAETMPLLCATAALQDWDGVFAFDYCSDRNAWASGRIPGFFSIGNHPTKMATLPAAAAMFLRADVAPARTIALRTLTAAASQAAITREAGYTAWNAPAGTDPLDALRYRCAWTTKRTPPRRAPSASGSVVRSDTRQITWGFPVTVNSARSKAVIGSLPASGVPLDTVRVAGDGCWAVVTLTAISGKSFIGPGRILVTAVADARNTGMQWKDATHTSVGSQWGTAPSIVDGVRASITLAVDAARVRVWALDTTGQRAVEVPVAGDTTHANFVLGPQYQTMWYEIAVQ